MDAPTTMELYMTISLVRAAFWRLKVDNSNSKTDHFIRPHQWSLVLFFFLFPSFYHLSIEILQPSFVDFINKIWQQNQILRIQSVLFSNDTDDIDDNVSDSNESESDYIVFASMCDDTSTDEQKRNFCSFDYE